MTCGTYSQVLAKRKLKKFAKFLKFFIISYFFFYFHDFVCIFSNFGEIPSFIHVSQTGGKTEKLRKNEFQKRKRFVKCSKISECNSLCTLEKQTGKKSREKKDESICEILKKVIPSSNYFSWLWVHLSWRALIAHAQIGNTHGWLVGT